MAFDRPIFVPDKFQASMWEVNKYRFCRFPTQRDEVCVRWKDNYFSMSYPACLLPWNVRRKLKKPKP